MQDTVETHDFTVGNNIYEIRVTRQAGGVEVQAYQNGEPAVQIASEFADWENSGDLRTYQNLDSVEEAINSVKSYIVEYHKRHLEA